MGKDFWLLITSFTGHIYHLGSIAKLTAYIQQSSGSCQPVKIAWVGFRGGRKKKSNFSVWDGVTYPMWYLLRCFWWVWLPATRLFRIFPYSWQYMLTCTLPMAAHFTSEARSLENVPWSFRMELDAKPKAFVLICLLIADFYSGTGKTQMNFSYS